MGSWKILAVSANRPKVALGPGIFFRLSCVCMLLALYIMGQRQPFMIYLDLARKFPSRVFRLPKCLEGDVYIWIYYTCNIYISLPGSLAGILYACRGPQGSSALVTAYIQSCPRQGYRCGSTQSQLALGCLHADDVTPGAMPWYFSQWNRDNRPTACPVSIAPATHFARKFAAPGQKSIGTRAGH